MQRVWKVVYSVSPFLVCAGLLAAALFVKPNVASKRIDPPIFEARDRYFGVAVAESGVFWLAGNNGKIIKSSDRGETWKEQETPGRWHLQDIASWDADKAIAVGNDGFTLVTINGGLTWEEVSTPKSEIINKFMRVKIDEKNQAWILGEMGALLVSADYGATWTRALEEKDVGLTDICFVGDNKIIVVGEFGTLLVSRDKGAAWQEVMSPVEVTLMGVAFRDQQHGVAVGLEGVILKTDDGGESWSPVASPTQENLFGVAWSGRDWVVAGDKGVFLRATAVAELWEKETLSSNDQSWRMEVVASEGALVLAGNSSGMLTDGQWHPFTN